MVGVTQAASALAHKRWGTQQGTSKRATKEKKVKSEKKEAGAAKRKKRDDAFDKQLAPGVKERAAQARAGAGGKDRTTSMHFEHVAVAQRKRLKKTPEGKRWLAERKAMKAGKKKLPKRIKPAANAPIQMLTPRRK